MNKQLELIRLFIKCGRVGKAEANDSAVGDTTKLIEIVFGVVVVVAMFFAGQYAAQHQDLFGAPGPVFQTLLCLVCIVGFFTSLMQVINQLYMASDLDVLVTMPFTPSQIVTGKLVSVLTMPLATSVGFIVPAAIGYFVGDGSLSVMFVISLAIGSLIAAVYSVCLAAALVMVLMRCFKFLRSRNVVSLFAALVTFAIAILPMMIQTGTTTTLNEQAAAGAFAAISGMFGPISYAFPFIPQVIEGAQGNLVGLALAVAIGLASIAVAVVFARLFYFQAALAMTDANGARTKLDEDDLKKHSASRSLGKELFSREMRNIVRTPSMLTNGILLSVVSPVIFIVPIVAKFGGTFAEQGFTTEVFAIIASQIPVPFMVTLASIIGLLFAALGVGLSSISRYIISREGKDFDVLRAMPIPMQTLVNTKRNAAMCLNGISGFLMPAIILIAAAVLGIMPFWIAIVGMVLSFAWLLALVNLCASFDLRKPNLNWESETDVCKNNVVGLIVMFIALFLGIGAMMLLGLTGYPDGMDIIFAGVAVIVPIAAAAITEIRLNAAARAL